MSEQKRTGKIVTITGVSVAGGELSLPKGHKYFINLTLDYSLTTHEDVIDLASGGQSVRVMAQGKLRGDKGRLEAYGVVAESLEDAVKNGLEDCEAIKFDVSTDFESEKGGKRDPKKVAESNFKKMDRAGKVEFVMSTLNVTREQAEAMVPNN